MSWIDSVEAVDPMTVRITSKAPFPSALEFVAGSLPKSERYSLNCAVIVKRVNEQTRKKVGINALLRDL